MTMSLSAHIAGLGARTGYIAPVSQVDVSRLGLTYEERKLLSLVGTRNRIEEVLSQSGLIEPRAVAVLLSLRRKGAIVPVTEGQGPPPGASASTSAEPSAERKERLSRHPYLLHAQRVPGLLGRARASLTRGEFEQALILLNQVVQLDPRNREAVMLLAEARRSHDVVRATQELERGQRLEQDNPTEALAAYRRACVLAPHNAEAAFRMARLGRQLGLELSEVRTHALRAVEASPERAEYHLLLAQVYLQAGTRHLARRHYEAVSRLAPDNAEAREALRKQDWSLGGLLRKLSS
jgi:tetratricopeptide (TPR) repeat protein